MFSAALIQALQGAWPHLAGEALVGSNLLPAVVLWLF